MSFNDVFCFLLYLWHFFYFIHYTLLLLISLYYKIFKFLIYINSCYVTVRNYFASYIMNEARYFYLIFFSCTKREHFIMKIACIFSTITDTFQNNAALFNVLYE